MLNIHFSRVADLAAADHILMKTSVRLAAPASPSRSDEIHAKQPLDAILVTFTPVFAKAIRPAA